MKVERENRTLYLTDIPTDIGDNIVRKLAADMPSMSIEVSYSGRQSNGHKAIVLDEVILPLIEAGLTGTRLTTVSTRLSDPE